VKNKGEKYRDINQTMQNKQELFEHKTNQAKNKNNHIIISP
jgi:hypothetical protein